MATLKFSVKIKRIKNIKIIKSIKSIKSFRTIPVAFLLGLLLNPMMAFSAENEVLQNLAQRVQVLEDREAIRGLIKAYGRAHDTRDYQSLASLFSRDGEWVSGMGYAKGPKYIFTLMDGAIGHNPLPFPQGSGTFHLLSNDSISIEGDHASSITQWIYISEDETGRPVMSILGHYLDEFKREDGQWKFLRREAPVNLPNEN